MYNLADKFVNQKAKDYATKMLQVFGHPDDYSMHYLCWTKVEPFSKIYIKDEEIVHPEPMEHYDFVYATMPMKLTPLQLAALVSVSGSIIYDDLKEEVTARCHQMVKNAVTLGFVQDVVCSNLWPTKEEYFKRIMQNLTPTWFNDEMGEHKVEDKTHHLQGVEVPDVLIADTDKTPKEET
jgi:hypothetical protein